MLFTLNISDAIIFILEVRGLNVIKQLRRKAGYSQSEFAKMLNVHQTAVSQWETDKTCPDPSTLTAIANIFNVSTDYLLGREGSPVNAQSASDASSALTPRDNRDIARDMAAIEASLESGEGLMFNGEPLSPEAKESLLAAMRLGLEAAKLKNKERFTPKKYRKD